MKFIEIYWLDFRIRILLFTIVYYRRRIVDKDSVWSKLI